MEEQRIRPLRRNFRVRRVAANQNGDLGAVEYSVGKVFRIKLINFALALSLENNSVVRRVLKVFASI